MNAITVDLILKIRCVNRQDHHYLIHCRFPLHEVSDMTNATNTEKSKRKRDSGGGSNKNKNRLEKDASIAIIGCGIASLSTAISLTQAGFTNFSIFERDACQTSRREGFGLTLSYNPKGPLSHLGILEEVAQQDCPSRSHYIFQPNGIVCGYYGNAFLPGRGTGQRGNIRIPRQTLQQIMTNRFVELLEQTKTESGYSSSGGQKIFWGHELTGIREVEGSEEKVEVELATNTTNNSNSSSDKNPTTTTVLKKKFDLVIAADGVRSAVVKSLAPKCRPKPLHVMLILGITDNFHHPLLKERGFYVLDGKHRLFTMPYEGDSYSSERRIMWQLSYRYDGDNNSDDDEDDETAGNEGQDTTHFLNQQRGNPDFLREKVLEICSHWHDPIPAMIRATPRETIWGTPLYDRQPRGLQDAFQRYSRVVVVGDALHACSPFKGQGANQSLLDGPLVAKWLQRASVDSAVKSIWRECVQRTDKVVDASRVAATFWHSPKCLVDQQESHNFAGVKDSASATLLLSLLVERKITASLSGNLDETIRTVIQELQIGSVVANNGEYTSMELNGDLNAKILDLASRGALSELRKLSLNHASGIRLARDEEGRSTLHLAALGGHYQTCRWLLTEAFVDPNVCDSHGRLPLYDASNHSIISFLEQVMKIQA